MIYDIIGDIHGQADKLIGLLRHLGYQDNGRFWQAPQCHQAIFIGDLIDRGHRQLDTLNIVFNMIDGGSALAVMGNHEYNAIAYATPHPDGGFCRPHTERNTGQHQAFLDEVGFDTDLHRFWLNRLYQLPLWLDLPEAHIIHACYDAASMAVLRPILTNKNTLTPQAVIASSMDDTPEFHALERLLKGIECPLPEGVLLTDGHGIVRTRTRIKWWIDDWQHQPLAKIAQLGSHASINLADDSPVLPTPCSFTLTTDKPIFIGHYWLDGTPALLCHQVACTDYSAGKDGFLTAYQFDTDKPALTNAGFVQYHHHHDTLCRFDSFFMENK